MLEFRTTSQIDGSVINEHPSRLRYSDLWHVQGQWDDGEYLVKKLIISIIGV